MSPQSMDFSITNHFYLAGLMVLVNILPPHCPVRANRNDGSVQVHLLPSH